VADVIEYVTTPNVYILHVMLIAVFRPLISAKFPYIIKPIIERVYGRIYIKIVTTLNITRTESYSQKRSNLYVKVRSGII
jgi:hypothetical protein